jgi:hypothetical protein
MDNINMDDNENNLSDNIEIDEEELEKLYQDEISSAVERITNRFHSQFGINPISKKSSSKKSSKNIPSGFFDLPKHGSSEPEQKSLENRNTKKYKPAKLRTDPEVDSSSDPEPVQPIQKKKPIKNVEPKNKKPSAISLKNRNKKVVSESESDSGSDSDSNNEADLPTPVICDNKKLTDKSKINTSCRAPTKSLDPRSRNVDDEIPVMADTYKPRRSKSLRPMAIETEFMVAGRKHRRNYTSEAHKLYGMFKSIQYKRYLDQCQDSNIEPNRSKFITMSGKMWNQLSSKDREDPYQDINWI